MELTELERPGVAYFRERQIILSVTVLEGTEYEEAELHEAVQILRRAGRYLRPGRIIVVK